MRLVVDHERCQGHGKCYLLAPALFEPEDDWGRPAVTRPHIRPDHTEERAAAELAVVSCPERAITLVHEDGDVVPDPAP